MINTKSRFLDVNFFLSYLLSRITKVRLIAPSYFNDSQLLVPGLLNKGMLNAILFILNLTT